MNKELLDKLQSSSTKIIEFIEKTGESTVDFAKEQVPLVIQDILNWGFVSNCVYASIHLILLIGMLVYIKKTMLAIWRAQIKDVSSSWLLLYFTYIPTILFLCEFISYLLVVLKINFAPRLYLLEQLQIIIKTLK